MQLLLDVPVARLRTALPEDVATATWSGFTSGEVVCLPGLEDLGPPDRLAQAELERASGNISPVLESRYQG